MDIQPEPSLSPNAGEWLTLLLTTKLNGQAMKTMKVGDKLLR